MSRRDDLLYLKKLKVMLSFFFDEDDVNDIAYDYTERFQIALSNGDVSDKVHDSLKSPWEECKKIIALTDTSPVRAFLSQKKFKLLLMILLFVVTTFCMAIWCEKRFINFLIPALCLNFIVFVGKIAFDRDLTEKARTFSVLHMFLLGYICLEILVIGIFLPHISTTNVGKICVDAVLTSLLILLVIHIIRIVTSISMHGILPLTHHVMMVVLISSYFVSQMHIMQSSIRIFLFHIIAGALCIYFESIVLYIFRIVINRLLHQKLWTRS